MQLAAPVKSVEDLLKTYDLDPKDYELTDAAVSTWTQGDRENYSIRAKVRRRVDLSLNKASGAPPVFFCPPVEQRDFETAFFFPDMQIGYKWNEDHTYLDPFHDRRAIDAAIEMCYAMQPNHIVILGDFLDFPTLSMKYKHRDNHLYRGTIQAAIEEGYYILYRIAMCCPGAKLYFTMGNHEERLTNLVNAFSSELGSVCKAQERDAVLTLPNLLRLNELHFTYNNGYDELMWLWPNLCIRHGEDYGAEMNAKKLAFSTVQGHAHRIIYSQRSIPGYRKPEVLTLMSPGCLCRIDGAVPAQSKNVDWQQGVGIATYDKETSTVHMYPVQIIDGVAFHRGTRYRGAPSPILEQATASATGITQFYREDTNA